MDEVDAGIVAARAVIRSEQERCQEIMRCYGISLRAVAAKTHVSHATVRRYVQGANERDGLVTWQVIREVLEAEVREREAG